MGDLWTTHGQGHQVKGDPWITETRHCKPYCMRNITITYIVGMSDIYINVWCLDGRSGIVMDNP